ncbi:MAG: hypothetical protein HY318_16825 [Armatimonadetes bacterium]|nr:hypothetical protein [Armatimonadota bacterium]
MSVKISRFEWDRYNVSHLTRAHPEYDLELLREIVERAKSYLDFGYDRFGRRVLGVRRGKVTVLFNLKPGRVARIFSVRED